AARLARPGVVAEGGTHYLVARSKLGRYVQDRDAFLVGDPSPATTPVGCCTSRADVTSSPGNTSMTTGGSWGAQRPDAADRPPRRVAVGAGAGGGLGRVGRGVVHQRGHAGQVGGDGR